MKRRTFLKWSAAGAGAAVGGSLTGPAFSAALGLPQGVFQYGVASGDPRPDSVIIWTRVTPDPSATPGSGRGATTTVRWVVARDAAFTKVVRRGSLRTSAASDHTVKVDVTGLASATAYYYRFEALRSTSPVGTLRTAPAAGSAPERLRFGMVSCANYTGGYFSAYRHLAARTDLDFVLHLGDYLYEYGNGDDRYGPAELAGKRDHDPAVEMVTLADYRRRHAQYKADPDLQALHRRAPFIVTWDDHEVTNDTWREGAQNHSAGTEGSYLARRNRAYQAYVEWMPIRLPVARTAGETRIYRRLQFGNLADVTMLDLRQYRDQQKSSLDGDAIDAADRTMTGAAQLDWLKRGLSAPASPRWRLIGNSVQIMPVKSPPLPKDVAAAVAQLRGTPLDNAPQPPADGFALIVDPWDGYTAQRRELLEHIADRGRGDAVFLTGDIHSSWAADLPLDPGTYTGAPSGSSPSAGVEFVCTSVTSDNLDDIVGAPPRTTSVAAEEATKAVNRHIKLLEYDSHGYSVVDVTAERVQVDWHYISDRLDPAATQQHATSWQTTAGSKTVIPADAPIS